MFEDAHFRFTILDLSWEEQKELHNIVRDFCFSKGKRFQGGSKRVEGYDRSQFDCFD